MNNFRRGLFIAGGIIYVVLPFFAHAQEGSLGIWTVNVNPVPAPRQAHSAVSVNGYLYVLGGVNNVPTVQSTAYYAKLNGDGSVGSWASANSLPGPRENHASAAFNGYVYVTGGRDASGIQKSTVHYAKINSDGSLGTWSTSANALPAPRDGHTSVVANGYLYVIGGRNSSSVIQQTVYYAKLHGDGSPGAWLSGTTIPSPTSTHASVVANGYVYVSGGTSGSSKKADVYYAKVQGDGSLGTWNTGTSLPLSLQDHSSVVANGYLYILAGSSDITIQEAEVYYTKLNSNGSYGSWVNDISISQATENHASVIANGFIYVIGGNASGTTGAVQYALGARTLITGTLDLLGRASSTLSDANDGGNIGGSLLAGNIFSNGSLGVTGNAQFFNGISVNGPLGVRATGAGDAESPLVTVQNDTGTQSFFTILRNGNIGVGTVAPSKALSVQGDAAFSGNLQTVTLSVTNSSATSTFAHGIRLSSGCFAGPDGVCISNASGGGGGGVSGSGSSGQLAFWSEASILSSNSLLYWDNTNKRLGIGTTTPAKSLSVDGDGLVLGSFEVGGALSAQSLNISGAINAQSLNTNDTVNVGGNITVSGNGTSTFSNGLSVANLKVNNLTEFSKLSVTANATSTFNGGIKLNSGCFELADGTCLTNSASSSGGGGGTSGTINSGSLGSLAYYSDSTVLSSANFLALDTVNSRLGIGTTTPDQALTIIGTLSNLLQAPITLPILASHTGLGQAGQQRDVAVMGNYAFVANGGPLKVFSIASTTPALIGMGIWNQRVSSLWLAGQYLYGLDPTTNPDTLRIFDISNPVAPLQMSSLVTSFDSFVTLIGTVQGNFFYTHQGGSFEVYDLSNPIQPYRRAVIPMIHIGGSNAITVDGRYAYNGGRRINIVDISNPDAPRVTLENTSVCNFGNISGGGMVAANGLLFLTTGSNRNLCILDVSDPTKLTMVSNTILFPIVDQYTSMKVQGRYLYAFAKESNNVEIVDISDPKAPKLVSVTQVRSDTTGQDVPHGVIAGRRLYYVEGPSIGDGRLWVLEVPGTETGPLNASTLRVGDIESTGRIQVQKELHVKGGVNIGSLGLYSSGPLGIASTNTPSFILGSLYVGASTPAPTDPEYPLFSQSTLVAKAKSPQSVPLTVLGFTGQTANYLQVRDAGGATKLVLDQNGRLGVGISAPTEILSVNGNVSAAKALLNKIELADEITGQPYCVKVVNGQLTTTPGACN